MSDAGLTFASALRPAALALAGLVLFAAGACDAGVERSAEAAVERAGKAPAPARAWGPAETIVEDYVGQMRAGAVAYDAALKAAGYEAALAEGALTSAQEFAKAPARIKAAKAAAAKHRDLALAQTDAAVEKLKALAAKDPMRAPVVAEMVKEFAAVRARRQAHWTHAEQIMDETHAAWATLDGAQGDWGLESDGLKFTLMKDKEAYDAHAARIGAYIARQNHIIAAQEASAANLRRLSRLYGS